MAIIALLARIVKPIYAGFNKPKADEKDLASMSCNLNHPEKFRILLGVLIKKLETHATAQQDSAILEALVECKLDSNEKNLLKQYVDTHSDIMTEMGNTVRIEKISFENKNATYIPSYAFVKKIHALSADQMSDMDVQIKGKLEKVYNNYTTKLKSGTDLPEEAAPASTDRIAFLKDKIKTCVIS